MKIPSELLNELKLYLRVQTDKNDSEARYLLIQLEQAEREQEEPPRQFPLIIPPMDEELGC